MALDQPNLSGQAFLEYRWLVTNGGSRWRLISSPGSGDEVGDEGYAVTQLGHAEWDENPGMKMDKIREKHPYNYYEHYAAVRNLFTLTFLVI